MFFYIPIDVESVEAYRTANRDFLLESMGIEHTYDTKVSDEFVRGVSCWGGGGGGGGNVFQSSRPSLHGVQSSAGTTAREAWTQAPP
jgi:hypothetical protein